MKVSRAADVAIRALVQLASRPPHNPISVGEICSSESVSKPHLVRVLSQLSDAGLVFGHGGGHFSLMCTPDEITVRMILEAVEGPDRIYDSILAPLRREPRSSRRTPLHPAWREVQKRMIEVLDGYTLESFALDAQFFL